jgi:hypothetical protein
VPVDGGGGDDLEKKSTAEATLTAMSADDRRTHNDVDTEKAFKDHAAVNIFSFQHLNYDISLGHGQNRRLLDDVSGYVQPGKLTALMGER